MRFLTHGRLIKKPLVCLFYLLTQKESYLVAAHVTVVSSHVQRRESVKVTLGKSFGVQMPKMADHVHGGSRAASNMQGRVEVTVFNEQRAWVGRENGIKGVGIVSLVLQKNVQRPFLLQTILPAQDILVSVDERLDDGDVGVLLECHVERVGVRLADPLDLDIVRKVVVDLFFREQSMLTTGGPGILAKNTLNTLKGEIAVAASPVQERRIINLPELEGRLRLLVRKTSAKKGIRLKVILDKSATFR
jgi:hypothetical protein